MDSKSNYIMGKRAPNVRYLKSSITDLDDQGSRQYMKAKQST